MRWKKGQFNNLGSALTATASIAPVKEFHTRRHTAYTPEVNLALDRVAPFIAAVKTKGRVQK